MNEDTSEDKPNLSSDECWEQGISCIMKIHESPNGCSELLGATPTDVKNNRLWLDLTKEISEELDVTQSFVCHVFRERASKMIYSRESREIQESLIHAAKSLIKARIKDKSVNVEKALRLIHDAQLDKPTFLTLLPKLRKIYETQKPTRKVDVNRGCALGGSMHLYVHPLIVGDKLAEEGVVVDVGTSADIHHAAASVGRLLKNTWEKPGKYSSDIRVFAAPEPKEGIEPKILQFLRDNNVRYLPLNGNPKLVYRI